MADSTRHLKNAPLAEALVEVKWAGPSPGSDQEQFDPGYPLTVGRLYERIQGDFPFIEELVPAIVPAFGTMHLARHRFRAAANAWPVVQLGPGVFTFNETKGYSWATFKKRAEDLLPKLFDAYPREHSLNVKSVLLRYINAKTFDYESLDVLDFLAKMMRTEVRLPSELSKIPDVRGIPSGLRLNLSFPLADPRGALDVSIATGRKDNQSALVWEFVVRSQDSDVPQLPGGFQTWLTKAHDLIERWFFELAKGDLLDEFDR